MGRVPPHLSVTAAPALQFNKQTDSRYRRSCHVNSANLTKGALLRANSPAEKSVSKFFLALSTNDPELLSPHSRRSRAPMELCSSLQTSGRRAATPLESGRVPLGKVSSRLLFERESCWDPEKRKHPRSRADPGLPRAPRTPNSPPPTWLRRVPTRIALLPIPFSPCSNDALLAAPQLAARPPPAGPRLTAAGRTSAMAPLRLQLFPGRPMARPRPLRRVTSVGAVRAAEPRPPPFPALNFARSGVKPTWFYLLLESERCGGRSARPRRKPVQPEKAHGATGVPSSGTTFSVHQQLPLEASLNGRS